MAKLSLKERLLNYHKARPGVRIPSGEMQRIVVEKTTYTAQNVGRRLRELAEDGELEVTYVKNHAYYSYNSPKKAKWVRRVVVEGGVAREVLVNV